MSENGNPEQEDFEAQVTDSVLADEEDIKPTAQKTADKAIGRSRSRSTSKHKSRSYRSRSRSRSYSRSRRSRRHRSRSYDRYEGRHRSSRYREGRSHSRSPMSNRRRHHGDRENPNESNCLGVFGLSLYTTERDLRDVYEHYGTLTNVNVVYDHQTGRSRGFAFVTFTNVSDAREARESTNGTEVDGRRIRVDYSITERAHTPTPGVYMGKPTGSRRDSYRERGYHSRGYHRSPSPHYYRRSPSPYYRRTPSPHYYRRSPSPYYRHHHHHSRRHHYYPRDRSFSPMLIVCLPNFEDEIDLENLT